MTDPDMRFHSQSWMLCTIRLHLQLTYAKILRFQLSRLRSPSVAASSSAFRRANAPLSSDSLGSLGCKQDINAQTDIADPTGSQCMLVLIENSQGFLNHEPSCWSASVTLCSSKLNATY
jgi:hypothetical protein